MPIKICQSYPNTIWQQNHCGVFVSHDGGDHWQDVTPEDGYGRYGFPITIDDHNPLNAWIIPAESDDQRVAKDLHLVVCMTEDGGKTWKKRLRVFLRNTVSTWFFAMLLIGLKVSWLLVPLPETSLYLLIMELIGFIVSPFYLRSIPS
ncbi:MAG: exo-alpha-sialidase [Saprospiraceae bacterium]|nr:exo-alpha-sialidase [Saprospiraceae bacterium]